MRYILILYLILPQVEWSWHRVESRLCNTVPEWEWEMEMDIRFRRTQKLTLLHVLYQEARACDKLICSLSSKVKKSLHPHRSFQHSWPHHGAGCKGFLTSLWENESSLCSFVSVLSGAAGLDAEVYVLPWHMRRAYKGSKVSILLMTLGKWEQIAGCCSSSDISWVPPCRGIWMGTASV